MIMKKQDSIVVIATVGLLAYTLLLSFIGPVVSSLQTNKTLGNQGSVKAVGVGVYWNSNGTSPVTSFNWGMIDPNSTKSITCYVKNEGNQILTLSMSASNWNPSNCTQYMTLSWNLSGATLNPGQIKTATFTLAVSASIKGITSFSFDLTIVGSS
jgi:hypothetical protein